MSLSQLKKEKENENHHAPGRNGGRMGGTSSKQGRAGGDTKEIMKTHAVYATAHPGALVVYGQQQQQQQYGNYAMVPPLTHGFGVGVPAPYR